ncbi:HD domain [Vibrio sp. B1FLJ16]|uniref:HD-GYP domain-containing protein n=1 Tax=Vibrio sp. B1FLJ16 TaxID=2751178 RepID=UPI0015F6C6E6|nr:HD domain-containing phosphohydrolase [Vibrio sp. B1FLJ16]CAD7806700.1 HD domain [Vibrio sp. B1FLJ16]CAE6902832.1 HD domain [Vibrio sp. B1FLJ16]
MFIRHIKLPNVFINTCGLIAHIVILLCPIYSWASFDSGISGKSLVIVESSHLALMFFSFSLLALMHVKYKNRLQNEIEFKSLQLMKSQEDMISMFADSIECRSGEMGTHVKRVSLISEKLAELYGLQDEEVKQIKIISPLHDLGKISAPDAVLYKESKLTEEEFEIIKTHTTMGYKILQGSDCELIQLASIVAHEHHEKWNGKGYPLGKKKEEIHIFSRIVAVADVFEALLSERPYKKPWSIDKVYELFEKERGHHFDPELVDILLNNFDVFTEIYDKWERS